MTKNVFQLTARDIMSRRAQTISARETIHKAIETMVEQGLSALPVVGEDGACVGVLTKTDVITLAARAEQRGAQTDGLDLAALYFGVAIEEITNAVIEDVMSERVFSVKEDDAIQMVAKAMLRHEVHHVPVFDASGRVVGVVSSMDLVKALGDAKSDLAAPSHEATRRGKLRPQIV